MTRPVLVAAGGTGGHIFPALAVASELNRRNIDVVWVGTRAGLESRLVPEAGFDIRWIDIAGLRGKSFKDTLFAPIKLGRACLQALSLVKELQPRAVLGMGGFVTAPVGLATFLMRKPLVLHEQNAIAGLTNRVLSRVANVVLAAMPDAFPRRVKARIIGNPLRSEIEQHAQDRLSASSRQFDASKPLNILVVGGSQGARALNKTVPATVLTLPFAVNLRHQTGVGNRSDVQAAYAAEESMAAIRADEFITNMMEAYEWSDLVICRAGAMTVAELAAMGLPSLLVPYPYAVDDHQTKNAQYLSSAGAARLLPEESLTVELLASEITRLHGDRTKLALMAKAAMSCHKARAAEQVADVLTELA
jgi:UDP-N-acetylglucosamine--N-acetylmuramyl-(pentapeptide) pyrophosphoryl-undecaprenol N-acetylglucosamine transferase